MLHSIGDATVGTLHGEEHTAPPDLLCEPVWLVPPIHLTQYLSASLNTM